ncbi:MAG TPA: bacteriohemerythrin [Gammaproteobacteria bacterium]
MEWNASLSVGVAAIDDQHRELLDLFNLIAGELENQPDSCPDELVQRLLTTAREHFRDEEALLARAGYPALEQHAAEHEQLMARLTMLAVLCGRHEASPRLLELLIDWLTEHIFQHDMPYKPHLAGTS